MNNGLELPIYTLQYLGVYLTANDMTRKEYGRKVVRV